MRLLPLCSLLILLTLGLGGCSNTMNGMGQDVEKAGQTIQNTF